MGAQLREARRRIKSVQSTKKITRAMELIAASRIVKAQQRIAASRPYAEAITDVVRTVTAPGVVTADHPLTTPRESVGTAALLLITSDRGLAGGYSANVLRAGEQTTAKLREQGVQTMPFLVGRKAVGFYRFRGRDISHSWSGFSEQPSYEDAKAVADDLLEQFVKGSTDGGVDEIHLVYTRFESMATQKVTVSRLLPLDPADVPDADGEDAGASTALMEFEPEGAGVLDALLPQYLTARIFAAMLDAAASEQSARRRAMKSATDNADELIKKLTRDANAARQAEITQEIMEIVGGAEALAGTGSEL
ncbi:MAG TPA: F0F1 ATP synthase subunit gamma [Mycobacteriales bacterium]|nr:F0F1 ATP synthase subunit gamma [Mycobacteriales bacterium]HWA66020.1 F0F1 ATP synthase subunit gamma [Mycobacteriales bacterium]